MFDLGHEQSAQPDDVTRALRRLIMTLPRSPYTLICLSAVLNAAVVSYAGVHLHVERQRWLRQAEAGAFSCSGTPSAAYHCLWGNVVRAMFDLRMWGDERLARAVDGLARSVTGDGYRQYLKSAVQAPGFVCAINYGLPCGWGAIHVLWALNAVPAEGRTPVVEAAVRSSIDFLLRYNIARAEYPYQKNISPNWFKFAYPLGYMTDILLNLEALTEAGVVDDPRLMDVIKWMLSKQDAQGRWKLEYSYRSRMWINIEKMDKPSKWVTLRALRVLKRLGVEAVEN